MKTLAIIFITIILIAGMIISSIYISDVAAEVVLDSTLMTTGITLIYKLGKE